VLPFDFYLPHFNVCIEYNGTQHYYSNNWFGGDVGFEKTKINDEIKKNYCNKKSIELIVIKYDENINEILSKKFIN